MRQTLLPALLAAAVGVLPLPGHADVPPPPGSLERAAAELITRSGHACPSVTRLDDATPAQGSGMAGKGLLAQVALCSNGRRYLVGTPPRRYGPPRPDLPAQPNPAVEPLP